MITFALLLALAEPQPTLADINVCLDHHKAFQRERRARSLNAARDCYERVFKEQPALHVARGMNLHYLYGETLWEARRFDDAAQAYRKGYALDPKLPNAWDCAYFEVLARLEHEKLARTSAEKAQRAKASLVSLRAVLAHVDEGLLSGPEHNLEWMRAMLNARAGSTRSRE